MRWIPVTVRLPEPGAMVLAYFKNDLGKDRIIRAQYSDGHSLEVSPEADWNDDWGVYDEELDCYWCPVGWFATNEFEEMNFQVDGDVTHWMPLPAGPGKEDYLLFNANNYVKVQLNEKGLDILRKYYGGTIPSWLTDRVDEGGRYRFQLHELMALFGKYMYMGCEPPFNMNILVNFGE